MMNRSDLERAFLRDFLVAGAAALALSGAHGTAVAADDRDAPETYTWSAELIAFDESAGTATVRSRVESHADIGGLERLSEGDRVMLTWTGLFRAAGIRHISPGSTTAFDRFTMPVEFVASEREGQYISFKVPVPAEDRARIRALAPGTWVTATSPHTPTAWDDAVVTIRAYNDVS